MSTPAQAATPDGAMLAQILLKQGEMSEKLAVMSTKLDAIPDHETRIRALEHFRYALAGLSAIGGILAGAIGYWIGHVLH